MKKRDFSLKQEYSKSWNYIKERRNFIYFVVGTFLFFALVGFFVPVPEEIANQLLEYITELLAQTERMSQFELTKFILFNNIRSAFSGILFGALFGIFPFLGTVANGYILGFVGMTVVAVDGPLILLTLLPHGIFELPAIFISFGLGIGLGSNFFVSIINKKFRKKIWERFYYDLSNSLRVFLFVVVPLLVLAAIIEAGFIAYFG